MPIDSTPLANALANLATKRTAKTDAVAQKQAIAAALSSAVTTKQTLAEADAASDYNIEVAEDAVELALDQALTAAVALQTAYADALVSGDVSGLQGTITTLQADVATLTASLSAANSSITTKNAQIATLQAALDTTSGNDASYTTQISTLTATVAARDATIVTRNNTIAARDATIVTLNATIAARDATIVSLQAQIVALTPTTISIGGSTITNNEGNSGNTAYSFTVTRSGGLGATSSVSWAVTGSGSNAATAADFGGTFPSGTLSWAANETTKTIVVNVVGDTTVENTETFVVTLSNPTGALLSNATCLGIITNDDSGSFVWPGPTNTGYQTSMGTLTAGTNLTTTANNQVIELRNFSGTVTINHAGVIFRKSKCANIVVSESIATANIPLIEDITIKPGTYANSHGIMGKGIIQRCDISNCENGGNLQGAGGQFLNNWIHDLLAGGADPHYDGIQCDGGLSNWLIQDNFFQAIPGGAGCIMIDNYFGPITNMTVNHNKLQGGNFSIYSDGQFTGGPVSGVVITNNIFMKTGTRLGGYYGVCSHPNNTPTWTNNTDELGNQIGIDYSN